jgi:hypothetical protein
MFPGRAEKFIATSAVATDAMGAERLDFLLRFHIQRVILKKILGHRPFAFDANPCRRNYFSGTAACGANLFAHGVMPLNEIFLRANESLARCGAERRHSSANPGRRKAATGLSLRKTICQVWTKSFFFDSP